ncbi:helix-turn-helix domain-containing protein [Streptomyces sp. NPDC090499]|uniref:helix-turn-helix domain-containing protein n=1 Tax=Streptomyces sp. NPDC090499 TaxID=3365965 RepID=UPI00381CDEEF
MRTMVGATRRHRRSRKAATKIITPDTWRKMSGEFMTIQETAEYLNVSTSWIYRNATRSGLTPYRFAAGTNAKIRFRVSEVEAWIRQQRPH